MGRDGITFSSLRIVRWRRFWWVLKRRKRLDELILLGWIYTGGACLGSFLLGGVGSRGMPMQILGLGWRTEERV